MTVYRVETPQGVLPYTFATEAQAREYAEGILIWQGVRWRIIREAT